MSWLDGNYLDDIKDTVWFATLKMLNPEIDLKGIHQFEDVLDAKNIPWTFPPNKIRHSYQQGQPDFNRDENIVFIYLSEENDEYGKFADSVQEFNETKTDKLQRSIRRIVFRAQFIIYGDLSYKIANKIKDSLFEADIKRTLQQRGIFIVPDLNFCVHAPEHHDAIWWERWDWHTRLNYLHVSQKENVGGLVCFDCPEIILNIDY